MCVWGGGWGSIVHPCRLIRTFGSSCLGSRISNFYVKNLKDGLVSVTAKPGLCLTWSETPLTNHQGQGYKTLLCSTLLSMKFILLINLKMPTIIGI